MSEGPGKPDCEVCRGRGIIPVKFDDAPTQPTEGVRPPQYDRCLCVLQQDIARNVERGMRKLMKAPVIPKSKFSKFLERDLWVTANKVTFMANLRHVAVRSPPTWYFKVVSDADLMTSWLASVALKGKDILDPDAAKVSLEHVTLVDLVMPPHLLIVRLGIKQARNVASPEVFLEALRHREHAGLPTWVWDTPEETLDRGHICWSHAVMEFLENWDHLTFRGGSQTPRRGKVETESEGQGEPVHEEAEGFVDLSMKPQKQTASRKPMRATLSTGNTRDTLRASEED